MTLKKKNWRSRKRNCTPSNGGQSVEVRASSNFDLGRESQMCIRPSTHSFKAWPIFMGRRFKFSLFNLIY